MDGCQLLLKFVEASWLGESSYVGSETGDRAKDCLSFLEYLSCMELAATQLVMSLCRGSLPALLPEAYLQELVSTLPPMW